jgi:hypothetical protein
MLTGRIARAFAGLLIAATTFALLGAIPAGAASSGAASSAPSSSAASSAGNVPSTSYSGTTADGAMWIGDVPSPWNGTVLLYSHGFGPLVAADAPDPVTKQALLNHGYALVGSSYDPNGSWWALGSARRDQARALAAFEHDLTSAPTHVLAVGTSMGGLISALEDQHDTAGIDGALTTCGIVAGGIQLNNYQLDGEYALRKLLAPGQKIKLIHFTSMNDGLNSGKQFDAVAQKAQSTADGRARLALAMALMNVSTWAPNEPMPGTKDYGRQEQEQYQIQFSGSFTTMDFVESGRYSIEEAAGGNGAWTAGVNFARLLRHSPYAKEVRALYRQAHLDLSGDLSTLTRGADIKADTPAIHWLQETSVPSGRLQVPELDLHTISDQLVPVPQENYYRHTVRAAGSQSLLRQAFVQRQLHCNFTPAELVAGVLAIQHRVESGHWGSVAQPATLEASALSLDLGPAAFIRFRPPVLSGNNGPFNPVLNGIG